MAVRNRPGRRQPDADRGGELSERFMCRVRQVVVKVYESSGRVRGRGHDEAAGAKPGTSPVDRTTVNVGTIRDRSRAHAG